MMQPSARVYVILIGILGILILAFILITIARLTGKSIPSQLTDLLSPTPIALVSGVPTIAFSPTTYISQSSTSAAPTHIAPTSTGADNIVIPQGEINAAQQKGALLKIVPYSQTEFTVTFDYGAAKFIVTLNDPKTTNLQVFRDWRQKNYPLLTESDYFIIK